MSVRRHVSPLSLLFALALVAAACSADDGAGPTTTAAAPSTSTAAPSTAPEPETPPALAEASFEVLVGTEQLTVIGADPGEPLSVYDDTGNEVSQGTVDSTGSLLFRALSPGATYTVGSPTQRSIAFTTLTREDHPAPEFYRAQVLEAPGFGYLTTRDGTSLSVNIKLPGPAEAGPYPTVVEYSGYTPSNPSEAGFSDLFTTLGYAYVGVNMRGTGCSGGSFRYFEYSQSLDGYDLVEAIAAQPWVQGNRVGMVGISYSGISQLFVAETQPPSLAAITPLSVLDDSYQSNLYPGGILNTGFAVDWTRERVEQARPLGQQWAADRIANGDEHCEANQQLRLQNPDLLAEIRENPFWTSPLGEELAPRTFVDRIQVPVFLAGAWQDEQTGGRFATMLDRFTGTDRLFVSLVNGLHTESLSPVILTRMVEFLDLYLAERTPSTAALQVIAPLLGAGIFGTNDIAVAPDRFDGFGFLEARAAFEAEPSIQVLFEQGAADGFAAGSPLPRFSATFDSWPVPAVETAWFLDVGTDLDPGLNGRLIANGPNSDAAETSYLALPDANPATFYQGSSSAIWRADVVYDWRQPPPGTAASFATDPLDTDLVIIGSGSADLWIRSNLGDTDLEVTVSDIRPDGTEVYVQSGWLRTSRRALDTQVSTALRPVHTHLAEQASPLTDGEFQLVRVEIYPFAHVFRAGSRLRVTIDAPGGDRAVWAFETIAGGERVSIAHDAEFPSKIVLAAVTGIEVPPGIPACGSLRGQPCRLFPEVFAP
jgi:predicted acyl esterase